MSKKNKNVLVKLVSTSKTGFFLVKKKGAKMSHKLAFNKYDPVIRKHVLFKEEKIK